MIKEQTFYCTDGRFGYRLGIDFERVLKRSIEEGGEIMNSYKRTMPEGDDYITAFRTILQEAERKNQEALDRFHAWSIGAMDPEEETAYTSAVKECAGKMKESA